MRGGLRTRRFVSFALLCAGAVLARDGQNAGGPLSPEQALASFELEPDYRIEIAAAEPLIKDPVAMTFDERGRLYVVENRGYPGPLEGISTTEALGVIALLEDKNGDGRYDTRSDFASGLTYPNGIMPWNGGVFVTCAPDILYLKDTTGDGVADERRVVLTGFETTKTPQIRVSHPTLGIDNWVYLTSGLNSGRVNAPDHAARAPVTFTASDSRFNPFTFEFELTGGRSQYGLTFDDYGRRFTCANRNPVWHVVLESRHLKRNPHLAFSETVQEVSTVGGQATVWPISADMTTASFMPSLLGAPHVGTFTAASGVHVHRGDALPQEHQNSIFICESAQNLVQRQVLSPNGVTFTSRPARSGREFLASRDNWFRPVFAANGPDGALYIVDMYRKTIDHPQYVPEASRALLDFEAGRERGRIYRIVAKNWEASRTRIELDRRNVPELVRTLEHPNAWWRETAQRLLLERRNRDALPELRKLSHGSPRDVARLHALWTLEGLGALETADIGAALRDRDAGIRENALRLAETRLRRSPVLVPDVIRLAGDQNERVRFQVALALGETADPRAAAALASIAQRDGAEPWIRAAILSSLNDRTHEFFRAFAAASSSPDTVRGAMMQDLGQLFGAAETPERCLELILQVSNPGGEADWQSAALVGIARGLQRRGLGGEGRSGLMTLLSTESPQANAARQHVSGLLARSRAQALDARAPASVRLAAIGLLGYTDYSTAGKTLESLLAPQHPIEFQVAAVRALAQLPERVAAAALVERRRWLSFTPEVREAALSALTADEPRTLVLLDAVEDGSIARTVMSPSRRSRLTNHRNASIQKRARALFAPLDSGDRMQAYERLRGTVLKHPFNAASGQRTFSRYCATCHTFDGAGGTLGPDLSGIRNQPAEAILLHVLVPDYEITPGYYAYVVETRDGRTLVGRLESEAPNSLLLRDAASQPHVVLRSQILSMTASPNSLMPNELERAMSEQELADLIGYLKSPRRTDAPIGRR
ncbi:MAG: PVC-type heme-binding CxxCH protein [Vicinamibacterales bacterium]